MKERVVANKCVAPVTYLPLGLILTKDLMKNSCSLWSVLHALWILGAGVIVVAGCATAPEHQASSPGGLVSVGRQAGEAPPANDPFGTARGNVLPHTCQFWQYPAVINGATPTFRAVSDRTKGLPAPGRRASTGRDTWFPGHPSLKRALKRTACGTSTCGEVAMYSVDALDVSNQEVTDAY